MFVALAAEAQNNLSFKTEELKKVAAELKLEGLDTLKIGYTFIQKNNHQLVVRKAENGMVEHIGIQLFPEAYRQQANGAVLDFLENGLLCNTYKLTKNQLKYMDAKFVKGNWSLMLSPAGGFAAMRCPLPNSHIHNCKRRASTALRPQHFDGSADIS